MVPRLLQGAHSVARAYDRLRGEYQTYGVQEKLLSQAYNVTYGNLKKLLQSSGARPSHKGWDHCKCLQGGLIAPLGSCHHHPKKGLAYLCVAPALWREKGPMTLFAGLPPPTSEWTRHNHNPLPPVFNVKPEVGHNCGSATELF